MLKIAFGLAVIAVILYLVGVEETIALFAEFNLALLPLILLFFVSTFFLNAANLAVLSNSIGRLEYKKALKFQFLGFVTAWILPGKIGQFSIVYFLKKDGFKTADAASIVVIDKLLTILALSIYGLAGSLLFLDSTTSTAILISVAGLWILALLAFSGMKFDWLTRKFGAKIHSFSKDVVAALETFRRRKKVLALNFAITSLRTLIVASVLFLLVFGFGGSLALYEVFFLSCLIQLIGYLPITSGGIGFKEAGFVYLAGTLGVAASVAFSAAFATTVLNYAAVGTIGLGLALKSSFER